MITPKAPVPWDWGRVWIFTPDNRRKFRNYLLIGIALAMTWLIVFNSQDILLGMWIDGRLRPEIVVVARYMGYMGTDKLVGACRKMMLEPERYGELIPWAKELQLQLQTPY